MDDEDKPTTNQIDNKQSPQSCDVPAEQWAAIFESLMTKARQKAGPQVLLPLSLLRAREQLHTLQEDWSQLVTSLYEVAETRGGVEARKLCRAIDEVDAGLAHIFVGLRNQ